MQDGSRTSPDDEFAGVFLELEERLERREPVDIEDLCRAHPRVAERLRRVHAGWLALRPRIEELSGLVGEPDVPQLDLRETRPRWLRFLERLEAAGGASEPYSVVESIAAGSSSDVLLVRDEQLGRELAMKIARTSLSDLRSGAASELERSKLQRFVAEARLTAQLDHPGVVPLHTLGLDPRGRLYFTMRLVRGTSFAKAIEHARDGREGWSEFRALEVLLRVCDAMEYAHSRLVVHRDLKPDNVLVGSFGETYVVDWGLARALLSDEVAPGSASGEAEHAGATQHGDVIGTPSYMAPEQAHGRLDEIDARSDVYSVGAMLYHLLAGRPPYLEPAAKPTAAELIGRVRREPPAPLGRLAPGTSPELLAICEKAMARERRARYATMHELAQDLRRFLSDRVVHAYERGTWAELKKLVRRNRVATAAAALAFASLTLGLAATVLQRSRTAHALEVQADAGRLADLARRAEELWPPTPELEPKLVRWVEDARGLQARRAALRAELDGLRLRASPFDAKAPAEVAASELRRRRAGVLGQQIEGDRVELRQLAERPEHLGAAPRTAFLQARVARTQLDLARLDTSARAAWEFPDGELQGRHDFLARLVDDLDAFFADDSLRGTFASVVGRVELVRRLQRESRVAAADGWRAASEAIADPARSPLYGGLQLAPQFGLAPLGPDPRSGLWEFALLASGEPPARDADGRLRVEAQGAVVLVLVPGGVHRRRWQPLRPERPLIALDGLSGSAMGHGPDACRLEPFFVSKYELTQAQWMRLTGDNPSYYCEGKRFPGLDCVSIQPVDGVSWEDAQRRLRHWGLALPSEAQWEWFASAGTPTRFWWGDDPLGRKGRANFDGGADFEDGREFPLFAPVGSFEPSPFGLHDVYGNAWELIADPFWVTWAWPMRDGDGASLAPESGLRVLRGGAMNVSIDALDPVTVRWDMPPNRSTGQVGVRPVRALER